MARPVIESAIAGLMANPVPSGTRAQARHVGSSAHAIGRYSTRSIKAWSWPGCENAHPAIGGPARRPCVVSRHTAGHPAPFSGNRSRPAPAARPCRPAYRGLFPHNIAQCVGIPAPRPGIACCRHGPGSPAVPNRIQPVLRRSPPDRPPGKYPTGTATRPCVNRGRIRACCPAARTPRARCGPNRCNRHWQSPEQKSSVKGHTGTI